MTVNELIKALNELPEETKKKPVKVVCQFNPYDEERMEELGDGIISGDNFCIEETKNSLDLFYQDK